MVWPPLHVADSSVDEENDEVEIEDEVQDDTTHSTIQTHQVNLEIATATNGQSLFAR